MSISFRPLYYLSKVLSVLTLICCSSEGFSEPIGYSVLSDGNDHLYRIDLSTGIATDIGPTGFNSIEGLAFQPITGVLYGYDESNLMVSINQISGGANVIDNVLLRAANPGLAFDDAGRLFLSQFGGGSVSGVYELDPLNGSASFVGSASGFRVTALEDAGNNSLWGLAQTGNNLAVELVSISTLDGSASLIGPTGLGVGISGGLGLGWDGSQLWGIADSGQIFTLSITTGAATLVATTLSGLEGFAIVIIPEPGSAILTLMFCGPIAFARKLR